LSALVSSGTLSTSHYESDYVQPPGFQNQGDNSGAPELLDSWKEIASYLGRAVRTVQTWEKEEGLPVHRHQHRRGGTVYAYPAEIDAWRLGREDRERNVGEATGRRTLLRLAAASALLGSVAALVWFLADGLPRSGPDPSRPVLSFAEEDRLLIAGFDNATGEELLNGTLAAALERDLRSRGFVSLVTRPRLGDSLRLLGRPLDSRVDQALAQEIAHRDQDIRAVVVGAVERSGSRYVLSLDLLDPAASSVLATLEEEARDQDEIPLAVERLSLRILASLGDPRRAIDDNTGSVSAPTLRALQLFSRADSLLLEANLGGPPRARAAAALLREAIAADSDFAAPHTHLAWAMRRQLRPAEEYLPHAERALQLSSRAPVAERYFIRGSFLDLRSHATGAMADVEEALAQYRALLELDPDHFWALQNASTLLQNLGRGQETLELALRSLRARPNSVAALSRVAEELVAVTGDLEEARQYVERAQELLGELPETASRDAFLTFYSTYELWAAGEVERVVAEVDAIVESAGGLAAGEAKGLAQAALGYYLDLGMFDRAEQLQQLYTVLPPRAWEFKMGWRRGDPETVRRLNLIRAQSGQSTILALVAADLALKGFVDESEEFLNRLPPGFDLAPGLVSLARGAVAHSRGQSDEARVELERAVTALFHAKSWRGYYFSSSQALSSVWETLGEPERAIQVLEEAARQKPRALEARVWWMESQLQLAALYREAGLGQRALAIEDEIKKYCVFADEDFPILVELERRELRSP
jgi:tetratricopeptide (TPR) repeat protein